MVTVRLLLAKIVACGTGTLSKLNDAQIAYRFIGTWRRPLFGLWRSSALFSKRVQWKNKFDLKL